MRDAEERGFSSNDLPKTNWTPLHPDRFFTAKHDISANDTWSFRQDLDVQAVVSILVCKAAGDLVVVEDAANARGFGK